MRFGIIVDRLETGGITTSHYEQSMLKAMDNSNSLHEIIIFTFSKLNNKNTSYKNLQFVQISDYYSIASTIFKILPSFLQKIIQFILHYFLKTHDFEKLKYYLKTEAYNRALFEQKIRIGWSLFGNGKRSVDIPYIATCLDCNELVHSYLPEFGNTLELWQQYDKDRMLFFKRAAYIVAGTHALKEQLIQSYGVLSEKIVINPLFIPDLENVSTFFPNNQLIDLEQLPKRYLFYPARFMPQKNHIVLLHAIKLLKEKYALEIELILVGLDKGNLNYLKRHASQMSISKLVHFLGPVTHSDIAKLYRNAFSLVFPAFNGPDNLPPIEAMYYGCPVIASNLEGSEEQFGNAALTFDPLNETELADRILQLLNSEDLRRNLINRGYECIKGKDAKTYATNILNIVNDFEKRARAWDEGLYMLLPNLPDK